MTATPGFLRIFTTRRLWGELLFALTSLPLGLLGFVYVAATMFAGIGLSVTFVGLPLLAVSGVGARLLATACRRLGNALVGGEVIAPPRPAGRPGLWGWIAARLRDVHAWRARLYLVLKLPVGVLAFVAVALFLGYGLGGVTYPIWRPFLPCQTEHGVCHRGTGLWNGHYADTFWPIVALTLVGCTLVLAVPWAVRGIVRLDRALQHALLGPTGSDVRVADLQRSRAVVVDDASATLRRIERDLHDGAQARLVALAMNVGLAREKLAEGGDAGPLLDSAHAAAKEAITELRDLARGIHPPALDAGLDASLATLASRSVVPTTFTSELAERPDRAIETIAYFCAAELLTNVSKHSGAGHANVDARTASTVLRLTVADDGIGGAVVHTGSGAGSGSGTGLRGLADRVAAVDGRLTVDSPDGGPTVVTVELPMRIG